MACAAGRTDNTTVSSTRRPAPKTCWAAPLGSVIRLLGGECASSASRNATWLSRWRQHHVPQFLFLLQMTSHLLPCECACANHSLTNLLNGPRNAHRHHTRQAASTFMIQNRPVSIFMLLALLSKSNIYSEIIHTIYLFACNHCSNSGK